MGTIVGNFLRGAVSVGKAVLSSNPVTGAAVALLQKKATDTPPFTTAPINPYTPLNQTTVNSAFPFQSQQTDRPEIRGGLYFGNERPLIERYGVAIAGGVIALLVVVFLIFKKK